MGEWSKKLIGGVLQHDRRGAPRAAVSLRVLFPWKGRIVETRTVDISATGMRIQTPVLLDVGARLSLRFSGRDKTRLHAIEAEVVWSRRSKQAEDWCLSGLRFKETTLDVVESLQAIVDEWTAEAVEDLPYASPSEVFEVLATERTPSTTQSDELQKAIRADHAQRDHSEQQADALLHQAARCVEAADYYGAIEILNRAMALAPHSREIVEELAHICYLAGDVVRAAALFDRAIRLAAESDD